MDIFHHTSTTQPAYAAPFLPMGPQKKGPGTPPLVPDSAENPDLTSSQSRQNELLVQVGDNAPMADQEDLKTPRMILLQYGHQKFPVGVVPLMLEVPAHLDVQYINVVGDYSMHTEYSSKSRKLDSPLLAGLDVLKTSQRKGVPKLWVSMAWAGEFAEHIIRLVGDNQPPSVIEIHPPFMDSTTSMESFLESYAVFEVRILECFPECRILIENRCGTKHPQPFLLSDADSILRLGLALQTRQLHLGIALDMAQMFTREYGSKRLVGMDGVELVRKLVPIHDRIHGLHLWGRGKGGGAHSGNLDGLFDPSTSAKTECLEVLRSMFSDGRSRYLVLEVNNKTGELSSVLEDLLQAGFTIDAVL
jgi:hypothetical protein